ncbi:MAG: sigma-54-dependent Fis family transcriptional regulator [Burkholderiales bacterium]|nr:sigma-54-dependent Fis family transcriptional regulator [Burkholderiales bacterium]
MNAVARGAAGGAVNVAGEDDLIASSWSRCVDRHRLQPDRVRPPTVLSSTELKDHSVPLQDLIASSVGELERLFDRLAEQDYLVMLTDADGVAVTFRCHDRLLDQCLATSVLPGSVWSEESQGTNGIGLCIQERQAASVVMNDHFASKLAALSCTVAPIFGEAGRLAGVLNVTTMRPSDRVVQSIVREVVAGSARRIENLYFGYRHARHRVLRISRHGDFCDMAGEARLAVDQGGRIVDATPAAGQLLAQRDERSLIGLSLGELEEMAQLRGFDDGRFAGQRGVPIQVDGRRLFLRLDEPQAPRRAERVARMSERAAHGTGGRATGVSGLTLGSDAAPRAQGAVGAGVRASAAGGVPTIDEIIGDDAAIRERMRIASRMLGRGLPLLLHGETGTGKSALARALHDASGRTGGFVSINCAAIPAELIESELFGYRPGSFTGASRQGSRGRLLEADGGTLFLDEIGDMPLALQSRLLHVLSDGEFVPVGASHPVRVDFALVSATLRDLGQLVADGRFRNDLYFRLNGVTLGLPPLRDRDDLQALIERMFARAANDAGLPMPRLDAQARRALAGYDWPGNVRELQHAARFAVALADGAAIDVDCLPPELRAAGAASAARGGAQHAGREARDERAWISQALVRSDWNVSAAADRLGISRATLYRRIRALGLARPGSPEA